MAINHTKHTKNKYNKQFCIMQYNQIFTLS